MNLLRTTFIKSKELSNFDNIIKISIQHKSLNITYSSHSNRIVDTSWDFRKANTKEYTHCFHTYPAMMIPQVARRIIDTYGINAKNLFDPYCGTGTSLVEANLKGLNAIGTDLNPLARLIATVKTTILNIQLLESYVREFSNYLFTLNFDITKADSILPEVKNIDFWFSENVKLKLGILLKYIEEIDDINIRNFFKVAFSETLRESSLVKKGEFKLVRTKNLEINENINVFDIFLEKLARNKQGLIEFKNASRNDAYTYIYDFNTVEGIPENIVQPDSVDIVVTSPPYGDSRTTVAYGQYSRLANEWLGYKSANQIDNILMGGEKRKHHHLFHSDILNDVIRNIQKQDLQRGRDVISFYEDYENSINNVSQTIKKKGYACYVVGNRTVKGENIPTDEITIELFKYNGFNHIDTIIRNIPNKRMPSKNSPSNVKGKTASTMKNEFIVICQKQ